MNKKKKNAVRQSIVRLVNWTWIWINQRSLTFTFQLDHVEDEQSYFENAERRKKERKKKRNVAPHSVLMTNENKRWYEERKNVSIPVEFVFSPLRPRPHCRRHNARKFAYFSALSQTQITILRQHTFIQQLQMWRRYAQQQRVEYRFDTLIHTTYIFRLLHTQREKQQQSQHQQYFGMDTMMTSSERFFE